MLILIICRGFIPEPEAVFYLKQIMSAFVELHSHKVMHRDFKTANIFLNGSQNDQGGNLVIGDFGLAKSGVEIATTRLGTPFNMAPEILGSTGKKTINEIF